MTPKERAAMQQALIYLDAIINGEGVKPYQLEGTAFTLREALADQAEHEPEVWYCPDCGTLSETQVKCCPDWIRSRKVPKNFAFTCKATFDRNVQAEQEPVVWIDLTGAEIGEVLAKHPRDFDKCVAIVEKFKEKNTNPMTAKEKPVAWMCSDSKLLGMGYSRFSECCAGVWNIPVYAAPVRTKDLTDEELWEAAKTAKSNDLTDAFRAVIAADRELNK